MPTQNLSKGKNTLPLPQSQEVCPVQTARKFDNPLRLMFHNPEKMLHSYVKPGMQVLDLGCGLGVFSIGMARLVGDNGCVYAADIQQGMLDVMQSRAESKGLRRRIQPFLCKADAIGLDTKLDFALAFWMLHETPDSRQCLKEIYGLLKPGGVLYIAEPKIHVSKSSFERIINNAVEMGYKVLERPRVSLSYAVALGI